MKRAVTDPFNPGVYALLLRTGTAATLRRHRGKVPAPDLLRAFRREVCFEERQRLIGELRSVAPLGRSARDLRSGKHHV